MISGREAVINSLTNIRNLPTVPQVMMELSNLLRDESHTQNDLTKLIGKDQSLTTKLLSIANSPLFGLPRKVSSIDLAVMLIGEEELSNIVIALSMLEAIKMDNQSNFQYMDYWKHSMIVAAVSKKIAKDKLSKGQVADAFVAGMLHDMGIQILVKYFKTEFEKIYEVYSSEDITFYNAELKVIGCSHQDIGQFLVQKWSFPESLCNVLAGHHSPIANPNENNVAAVVNLADYIVDRYKMGNVFWDEGVVLDTDAMLCIGFNEVSEVIEYIDGFEDSLKEQVGSLSLI
jgi:HD-like signal output (HDOD) protein